MQEETKVDKDFLEAYNQGYELSKELGLKSDILNDLAAGNNRMQAMQKGMEQYEKELSLEKDKAVIPPFDMDSFDDRHIDVTPEKEEKGKDKDMDI
ncbi:MAG: hypothetical protein AAF901_08810 [Bacteroidota bacterium]